MRWKILDKNSGGLEDPPSVCIMFEDMRKILTFVNCKKSTEINGWGFVDTARMGNNDFLVSNAFILEQNVSPARAVQNPLAFARFVGECENHSKLRFQWHSHLGPVFFSEEDIETIRGYLGEYMISLVVNKRGEYRCRVDVFKPFYFGMEVPVYIVLPPPDAGLVEFCRQEIKNKVKEKSPLKRKISKILEIESQSVQGDEGNHSTTVIPWEHLVQRKGDEEK